MAVDPDDRITINVSGYSGLSALSLKGFDGNGTK